jgi:hypothetical protein
MQYYFILHNIEMAEEDNSENSENYTSNKFIDKVTLQLLMNKNQYNRYLSQSDPKKHKEHLEHLEKIKKYRNSIINMTKDFIDNSNHQVTTEVNDAFDYYVRTIIKHIECKKIENADNIEKDEDILFGNMDSNTEEESSDNEIINRSFWGKNKVVKKTNIFDYPINYIPMVKDT